MVASRHSVDDARVVHKEAESLVRAGHDVVILLSCDERLNYRRADGSVALTGVRPDGAARLGDIRVLGVPKQNTVLGKVRWIRAMVRLAVATEADAFHAHEPDVALLIAWLAKRRRIAAGHRSFLVHDMHEYPPGGIVDRTPGWAQPLIHWLFRMWDAAMLRRTDHVFTANAIVRGYALAKSYKTTASVLYNGPSLALFPQHRPAEWNASQPLVLCHEGTLGFNRGLREMLQVIAHFKGDVRLRIVGKAFGAAGEFLRTESVRLGITGFVEETGWLPYTEVGSALAGSHGGLILFRSCYQNVLAGPPNKLFNYMNAGLPVVTVDFPEMRRIVTEEACGVLIDDQSVGAILRAVSALMSVPGRLSSMGANGQRAVRDRYSWEQMERVLLADYERMQVRS